MKLTKTILPLALVSTFALGGVVPQPASAQTSTDQKQQKNKNDWRNIAGAAGAVAGYGLLKGDKAATIIGAAGAAYSAKRYEDARKAQSQTKAARARYHRADSYTSTGRKYYTYNGHQYYMDLNTGERHLID